MPRITDFVFVTQKEQIVFSVRTITKAEDLPAVIGQSYRKIAAYLKEMGVFMTDVPFTAYHNTDMQNLDVEIGFPVSGALPPRDDMRSGIIPEGKAVFCMYRGPYSEMAPVYAEMGAWIEAHGARPVGTAYEYYFNGPAFPESEYLTKILMPVR